MERITKRDLTPSERFNVAGLFGIGLGVVLLMSTTAIPEASAAFPRLLGYAMVVLGSVEVLRSAILGPNRAERLEQEVKETARAPVWPVLIFVAATLSYVMVLPVVGFYVTTFVFLTGTMLLMGVRKVFVWLGVPVLLLAVVYFFFTMQLGAPLPRGLLM